MSAGETAFDAFGPEVLVADADVLLGDACEVLKTGHPSSLLHAVDAGSALGFISDRAYRELGWMSARAARGHGVDHEALRAILVSRYLPRFAVVVTPMPGSANWMPSGSEVSDPDDVPHVQVAKLVSAAAVYSHDRHLRTPGVAPASRAEYDKRVVLLSVLARRREAEDGLSVVLSATARGTAGAVSWASNEMKVKPTLVWSAVALMIGLGAYLVLAPEPRRQRLGAGALTVVDRVATAIESSDDARRQLRRQRLLAPEEAPRLETRVATFLARNGTSTKGRIAEALHLTTDERRHLSRLLGAHPSFELVSRNGWAVGRIRTGLETQPSATWRPRSA